MTNNVATADVGADEFVDCDADNLADAWEVLYFEHLLENGAGDTDADGLDNSSEDACGTSPIRTDTDGDHFLDGFEILAGTDPLDATSSLGLTATAGREDGKLYFQWSSVAGKSYHVRYCSVAAETPGPVVGTNVAASPPENTYTAAVPATHGWYSLELAP